MADEQDASSASPDTAVDAADQAVLNGDQAAFKEVRLAQRAGKPVPTILPTSADPAPAPPVEQAASTEAPKAASEPAKPKKNADTRVQELLADRDRERSENARLRTENETLKRQLPDAKPAESSPAKPTTRDFERFKAMPDAPKLDEFNDYQDWSVEMAAFVAGKRLEEYSRKQQQDYDAGQFRDAQATFDAKGVAAHADFRDVLTAAAQAGRQWPEHVTRKVFTTGDQGIEIAYALGQAKDDDALYARIGDPVEFGEYVGEFLASQKAAKKSTVPQKTSAPDPPFTLGSKPHESANELESAVESGDMHTFKAERLRRRVAALQR